MGHFIIDGFLLKKVFVEHLGTGIKVKGSTFSNVIKIIVLPLTDSEKEIFYFFELIFKRKLRNKSIQNEANEY